MGPFDIISVCAGVAVTVGGPLTWYIIARKDRQVDRLEDKADRLAEKTYEQDGEIKELKAFNKALLADVKEIRQMVDQLFRPRTGASSSMYAVRPREER